MDSTDMLGDVVWGRICTVRGARAKLALLYTEGTIASE